jgi:hypothetical protein
MAHSAAQLEQLMNNHKKKDALREIVPGYLRIFWNDEPWRAEPASKWKKKVRVQVADGLIIEFDSVQQACDGLDMNEATSRDMGSLKRFCVKNNFTILENDENE